MPVALQDRPLRALREETIDQLIVNYGHGKLSLEAFERRLDAAFDAVSHDELLELTADLDLKPDKQYADDKRAELGIPVDGDGRDVEHLLHIFGGTHRRGVWDVAREIRMVNIFGGGDLDFSEARFAARTTRIKMLCIFGGATLHVPEGMNTISRALCIFGGVTNRTPPNDGADAPTIIVEGLMLFGGAEIKIKKTFKKRCMEFADTLKGLFGSV
jgi:DUF1707 SHOCT-like domain